LTKTSELSRNLYNSNISLEEKHKAFLAHLPTPSAMTPRSTPSSSPVPTPENRPIHLPRVRNFHAHRISASPSDLALLADQNAELLQKLETDSAQANLAGRRRLGKLEKDIDGLREKLDQYRTQSDALQSQVVARVDEEARRVTSRSPSIASVTHVEPYGLIHIFTSYTSLASSVIKAIINQQFFVKWHTCSMAIDWRQWGRI
jgi:hypothetical protein